MPCIPLEPFVLKIYRVLGFAAVTSKSNLLELNGSPGDTIEKVVPAFVER